MTVVATNEGIRVTPAEHCRLCGKEGDIFARGCRDRIFDAPGEWSIRDCQPCGLAWLDPQPHPDDIGRIYDRYHTHESETPRRRSPETWKDRLRRSILARTLGYPKDGQRSGIAAFGVSNSPLRDWAQGDVMWLPYKDGYLLDVGCGSGAFLARMKELGWHVEGVEPDPKAARLASEAWSVKVHAGSLDDLDLPTASYDAITLSHVIEHVPDPVATLRQCGRLLKDDGLLVVTTPNRESLAARRFASHWRGWESPRHLHIFATRSLHKCALRAGLQVAHLRTTARATCFMWRASAALARHGRLPGGRPPAKPLRKRMPEILVWLAEHYMSRLHPVGEEVLMIGRRAPSAVGVECKPRTD